MSGRFSLVIDWPADMPKRVTRMFAAISDNGYVRLNGRILYLPPDPLD